MTKAKVAVREVLRLLWEADSYPRGRAHGSRGARQVCFVYLLPFDLYRQNKVIKNACANSCAKK